MHHTDGDGDVGSDSKPVGPAIGAYIILRRILKRSSTRNVVWGDSSPQAIVYGFGA
jgi:hypothetical protein